MRVLVCLMSLCLYLVPLGWAQETESQAKILSFGVGIHFIAAQKGEFPTGASVRVWMFNQFALEVDMFTRENNPTFTLRAFYKVFDNGIVSLFGGGGVAFFSSGLTFDATLQAVTGLDIRIGSNLVFNVEVGVLAGASTAVPVTAGGGIYYFF